jgi:peroxiredoxin
LINQVFNNYFSNLGRTKEGNKIYTYINRDRNYLSLLEIVKNDLSASNDSLPELVILKSIFEGFYQKEFSNKRLLEILDSLQVSTKIFEHRIFAKQIREDVTRLMKGFPAPDFALENSADSITELNALKGKYVYLCFCSTRSYPCMNQFILLGDLLKKFNEKLTIVIVMADNDSSLVKKFAQDYGFEGIVLIAGTRNDLLKQYRVNCRNPE